MIELSSSDEEEETKPLLSSSSSYTCPMKGEKKKSSSFLEPLQMSPPPKANDRLSLLNPLPPLLEPSPPLSKVPSSENLHASWLEKETSTKAPSKARRKDKSTAEAFKEMEDAPWKEDLEDIYSEGKEGDRLAQFQMANLYYKHRKENSFALEEAFRWYMLAAKQGHSRAQFMVGVMYKRGENSPSLDKTSSVDPEKCNAPEIFKWYTAAASNGHRRAQFKLGIKYLGGLECELNLCEGFHWLHRSAEKYKEAKTLLEFIYNPQGKERPSIYDRIKNCIDLEMADHPYSLFLLGMKYEEGINPFPPDLKKATHWYMMAAKEKVPEADTALSRVVPLMKKG